MTTAQFKVILEIVDGEVLCSDIKYVIENYLRSECPGVVLGNVEVEEE